MTIEKNLSVLSQNLCSVDKNFQKLRDQVELNWQEAKCGEIKKFDVICGQEAWKIRGNYILPGYGKPHHISRSKSRGGGS